MKKRITLYATVVAAFAVAVLFAQDIQDKIVGAGGKPALAVVDFRGTGPAQAFMGAFNSTLYSDLQNSALFDLKPKSMFPLNNPQTPADLTRPEPGFALKDWAGSPVNASHLVFGYTAVTNGVLALYGNVYDTRQQSIQSAQLFAKTYAGSPDQAGAIYLAHQFANDIIQKFGGSGSLLNSRIYFVSNRGAAFKFGTELWVMDWDGSNQTQLTHLGGQLAYPAISPDGSRLAVTLWPGPGASQPRIEMINSQTGRPIAFLNQTASINASAGFTPDGTKIFYSSTATGEAQIYSAGIDGRGFSRVTSSRYNPTEPKVNPKNPGSLLFVQGSPNVQIYRMNAEGAGIERVTNGEGEAANPAWSPDGQHVAFAWTRGYQKGDFNIFVIDIAAPEKYNQLTHSEGKNENPVWAPDGIHLVFTRTPSRGAPQIYTMLSDGTQVKQLTTQGSNRYAVWGVK